MKQQKISRKSDIMINSYNRFSRYYYNKNLLDSYFTFSLHMFYFFNYTNDEQQFLMMSQISHTKYHKAVRVRDSILQQYSIELIKEKNLKYKRTKAPSLLKLNRFYLKYNRNIKLSVNMKD